MHAALQVQTVEVEDRDENGHRMDPADRQLRRGEGDDRQAEQRNEHDGLEEVLDRRRRVLEIRSSIQQIRDREPDAL